MAGNPVPVDGLTGNIAGMSKNQLYGIVSQMKTLIEQNEQQSRQILIQNPHLTKALFQAQIMLGMVQPPKPMPSIQPTSSQQPQSQSQPPIRSAQQSNNQPSQSVPAQAGLQNQPGVSQNAPSLRKQTASQSRLPTSSVVTPPARVHSQPVPSNTLQMPQQSKGRSNTQGIQLSLAVSAQPPDAPSDTFQMPQQSRGRQNPHGTPMSHPQSAQPPNAPLPSLHQSQVPIASSQLQQPQQTTGTQLPLQPSMPPQYRPSSVPHFQHQYPPQAGPPFQYNGSHNHPSQHMSHSGNRSPPSIKPSFPLGQPQFPNHPSTQQLYQGGSSRSRPDYNRSGSSTQVNRGSSWPPPHSENPAATQFPGPSQLITGQMGPGNQPPRPSLLTPDMEKALLQQVMSLTPEQINLLPPDQRNQVLQLQQMLRR